MTLEHNFWILLGVLVLWYGGFACVGEIQLKRAIAREGYLYRYQLQRRTNIFTHALVATLLLLMVGVFYLLTAYPGLL